MRDEQILVLNDQGGTVMHITYDMTEPLRANMKHHEPIILEPRSPDGMPRIYENGVVPTLNTCGGDRVPCVMQVYSHRNDEYAEHNSDE